MKRFTVLFLILAVVCYAGVHHIVQQSKAEAAEIKSAPHDISVDVYRGTVTIDKKVFNVEIGDDLRSNASTRSVRLSSQETVPTVHGLKPVLVVSGISEAGPVDEWYMVEYYLEEPPKSPPNQICGGFTATREKTNGWDWKFQRQLVILDGGPNLPPHADQDIGYVISVLEQAMLECHDRKHLWLKKHWSEKKHEMVITFTVDHKPLE